MFDAVSPVSLGNILDRASPIYSISILYKEICIKMNRGMLCTSTYVCTLMYIAYLCPSFVSVHIYAICILHFKLSKFFIYLSLVIFFNIVSNNSPYHVLSISINIWHSNHTLSYCINV